MRRWSHLMTISVCLFSVYLNGYTSPPEVASDSDRGDYVVRHRDYNDDC